MFTERPKDSGNSEFLEIFVEHLREQHNLDDKQILKLFRKKEKDDVLIPLSVFSKELGALEAIVKFLRENSGLRNKRIAILLNRNQVTIAATYRKASMKVPSFFIIHEEDLVIPSSILRDRKYSTLESIVHFLIKIKGENVKEVAKQLHRSISTIWTIYNRLKKKEHLENEE